MSKEITSAYLHIGNSGVTFSVIDEGFGPCIVIKSSSFGTNVIEQKIHVSKHELAVLSSLFDFASNKDYSEVYCNAARVTESNPCSLRKECQKQEQQTSAEDAMCEKDDGVISTRKKSNKHSDCKEQKSKDFYIPYK